MSTTILPHPAVGTAYRDPYCRVTDPGHVCTRRDGQPLNGANGDCWTQARLDTITWMRRPRPGLGRTAMAEAEQFQAKRGESYGHAIVSEGTEDIDLRCDLRDLLEDIAWQYPTAQAWEVHHLTMRFLRAAGAGKRKARGEVPPAVPHVCSCPSPRGCHVHGPQPREWQVACQVCGYLTWNVGARCDRHIDTHGEVA